ncbi:hypothetical protein [Halopseudomonas pelagia]|uniref:hypothetical protein n=1 Tax=Halopseudomonas pelagia TaxID=553151 RepID=UPI0003B77FC0|nr:hypothetical protein [Halopseudomonas pelagia]
MMLGADLKRASQVVPTLTLNIITHSALGRYAVQIQAEGLGPQLLLDGRGRPRYWSGLAEVRAALRAWGFRGVSLTVIVPQDEIIGRQ